MRFFLLLSKALVVLVAIVAMVWLLRAYDSRSMPPLKIWHTESLENEFRAADYPDGLSLNDYYALESRLMRELRDVIVDKVPETDRKNFSRYTSDSPLNPENLPHNWNRSFALPIDEPRGGILLLHGASDSPYSLREIAEIFHEHGFQVLALRLPGHGTIPSGLKDATADDWRAVTRLGVGWLRESLPEDVPIYLGGYSTGATLIVDYTLDALGDSALAVPDRLFLFSPAIGISQFAAFAYWDVALSRIPAFEKFAWGNIYPEYDPFKYNSFAKNAGDIVYELTVSVGKKILAQLNQEAWKRVPPTLTFHSLVDSTVSTSALVTALYDRIVSPGQELVLFDLNRDSETMEFIRPTHLTYLREAAKRANLPYSLTVVTNREENGKEVVAMTRCPPDACWISQDLGLVWPSNTYSLSHVAIPFPPNDPMYGIDVTTAYVEDLMLGALQPRGEREVLLVPVEHLTRLRYNPFFSYLRKRVLAFCPDCEREE